MLALTPRVGAIYLVDIESIPLCDEKVLLSGQEDWRKPVVMTHRNTTDHADHMEGLMQQMRLKSKLEEPTRKRKRLSVSIKSSDCHHNAYMLS